MRPAGRVVLLFILLPVLAYAVWDQLETRALARDVRAIQARGEPITLDDEPAGADTPERHDAARIYAAAVERARSMPQELTFRLGALDVDNTAGPRLDLAQLEQIYKPDAPALQLLDQATPLDFNGFGDVPTDPRNSPMLTLNSLAALRADLFSARGEGDAAARALIPCVRLWRAMPLFSRFQLSMRLLGSTRIMLRHSRPGEAALIALQHALAQLPDTDDLVRDVQLRRARFIDSIEEPPATLSEAIVRRTLRPVIARSHRNALATYDEALAIARRPWPEKFVLGSLAEARYAPMARSLNRPGFFTRISGATFTPPGIGIIGLGHTPAGLELAARRVVLAALAVERYRRGHADAPPASLDALVPEYLARVPGDPFSGAPLVYRASATDYLVYSIDVNRKDDGGALYGLGSKAQNSPRQGAARDLGIHVEMRR